MGQWDSYLQKQIIDEAQETGVVEPATNVRGPYVPVGATSYLAGAEVPEGDPNEIIKNRRAGKVIKRNLRQQLDSSFGLPAKPTSSSDLIQPSLERKARVDQSKIEGTATAAKGRSDRKVSAEKRRKEVAADISTTTMRMINGVAFDTDYGRPAPVIAGTHPAPARRPAGDTGELAPMKTTTRAEHIAEFGAPVAPETFSFEGVSKESVEDEMKRRAKKANLLKDIDVYDPEKTGLVEKGKEKGNLLPGYENPEFATTMRLDKSGKPYDSGQLPALPSELAKREKTKQEIIEKSKKLDVPGAGAADEGVVVPTAPQLENLGNSGAVENRDVDNYDASKKEGKIKQTTKKDAARLEGGAEETVTDKVKEPYTIAGKNDVDTQVDEDLRAATAADDAKTLKEKGQRNDKPVKVDSSTPFDQQDLWDAEGNVKPQYQDGPSSTTMTAKKNWGIQPIYKSPELQAKHEKRQKYADDVNKTIQSESLKHLDTEYASADESKAAFARLQTRHATLRANVDKYHPVPEGGYFNENVDKDTSSESYEEMPGVKIQPSPQPQNVKDDSNVVPERLMNRPEEASDAQLAADDRRLRNNRTAVTGTRQLDFNNISARPTRGRTREQELVDLSQAAARNQKLEASGKRLQTHSPEVMLRARLSADAAGVSPSVYNSPTFHQNPEGRIHVRDAYLRHTAAIGDDKESSANMDKFIGGNANEANAIKDGAYQLLQNRERFNSTKEPGTGYRYNPGLGNLDIKTAKFRASNGEAIPMSQTDHPEHPGFDLEGGSVGFKGSVPAGQNEDGTTMYEALKHPKTGEDLVHGWHPYKINGETVFEHHTIPENAIHHGDIIEQGLQTGESGRATLRKLIQGKESAITANGLAINLQPSAPEFVPTGGTTSASKASRESHATIAGTFMPPTPRRGRVGTGAPVVDGELPTRKLTPAERANKKNIPTTDDSKSKVSSVGNTPYESSDLIERMKVGPKPEFHLGHGSLEDISAAHAGGHIDGDHAYELAVDAGYFPGAKSKFTKVEE